MILRIVEILGGISAVVFLLMNVTALARHWHETRRIQ